MAILRAADPGDKLEVYRELGLKLTYNHEKEVVTAQADPRPQVGVLVVSGGGLGHYARALRPKKVLVLD